MRFKRSSLSLNLCAISELAGIFIGHFLRAHALHSYYKWIFCSYRPCKPMSARGSLQLNPFLRDRQRRR
ncbi:hypothetical protein DOM21_10190 [Bacteriovorax stolpii]|nr:hypothetical protein DOM21_10190 [Bacteriovorax stolpii]